MSDSITQVAKCPRCGSRDPKKHPAMQFEGEVQLCAHPWHVPNAEEAKQRFPDTDPAVWENVK